MSLLWVQAGLTDHQQAALAEVHALPDDPERVGQVSGPPAHRLMAKHNIIWHPSDPFHAGFDVSNDHSGTAHFDPHEELHTGQGHLYKPALVDYIKHGHEHLTDADYEGEDGSPSAVPYHPETFTHQDKHWIGEGHHRILAARMLGKGVRTHHRDVDGEHWQDPGYAHDVDYDKP